MAGDARHILVGIGAAGIAAGGDVSPDDPVIFEADGFRQAQLFVVVGMLGVDGVGGLLDDPGHSLIHHRVLDEPIALDLEPFLAERRAQGAEVETVRRRRRTGGREHEARRFGDGAVTVDALDFDRVADLAVELAVAVRGDEEVAIDAVHPFFDVDIHQMNRHADAIPFAFDPFLFTDGRDGGLKQSGRDRFVRNRVAVGVEQVPFAVLLHDCAIDPAVAVELGELAVSELGVEFADSFEERRVAPKSARRPRRDFPSTRGRIPLR